MKSKNPKKTCRITTSSCFQRRRQKVFRWWGGGEGQ